MTSTLQSFAWCNSPWSWLVCFMPYHFQTNKQTEINKSLWEKWIVETRLLKQCVDTVDLCSSSSVAHRPVCLFNNEHSTIALSLRRFCSFTELFQALEITILKIPWYFQLFHDCGNIQKCNLCYLVCKGKKSWLFIPAITVLCMRENVIGLTNAGFKTSW